MCLVNLIAACVVSPVKGYCYYYFVLLNGEFYFFDFLVFIACNFFFLNVELRPNAPNITRIIFIMTPPMLWL
jgi:hypothetical protein